MLGAVRSFEQVTTRLLLPLKPGSTKIGCEFSMAREASHLHRLLALLDQLLCRPPLVVKPHYRQLSVSRLVTDEPHSGEQLPEVELPLRRHPSRCLPTSKRKCGLILSGSLKRSSNFAFGISASFCRLEDWSRLMPRSARVTRCDSLFFDFQ